MWRLYSYTVLLLFISTIIIFITFILKSLPLKIKIAGMILVMLIGIRYSSLFIMLLSENIRYLYLLKPFYFSNLLYIPTAAFVLFYIFLRKNKLNFSYIFLITGIFFILYYGLMVMASLMVSPSDYYGYIMKLLDKQISYWAYAIFNTIVFFTALLLFKKGNAIKSGIFLMMIAASVSAAETLMSITGYSFYPDFVMGDFMWATALLHGFQKIKR